SGGPNTLSNTIAGVLRPAIASRPGATAIVAPSGRLSYAELDRAADAAAGALWSLGVRLGDRVAACLPNDLDIVIAFHGAQRIGAGGAGVNGAWWAAGQRAIVRYVPPAVILAGEKWKPGPVGATVIGPGEWRRLLASAPAPPAVATEPDAPAAIGFTSG